MEKKVLATEECRNVVKAYASREWYVDSLRRAEEELEGLSSEDAYAFACSHAVDRKKIAFMSAVDFDMWSRDRRKELISLIAEWKALISILDSSIVEASKKSRVSQRPAVQAGLVNTLVNGIPMQECAENVSSVTLGRYRALAVTLAADEISRKGIKIQ